MNSKIFRIVLFIIPAIILASYGCSGTGEATGDTAASGPAGEEPVRVIGLDYSKISRTITYPANLQAFREVHMASASPGRIERIHVEAGTRVTQGQLLVEMDKTQLMQAMMQLQNIEKDYHRLDTLRKVGSVSLQQYDQVRMQYELALSNVEFLRENTRLLAPFGGTVSGKYFENGEMFSGVPNTMAGKAAILTLVQTSRLKALVNVSEKYYPLVTTGMTVKISSDIWPGKEFSGSVTRIYPTIETATRTFTIELAVPNSEEILRPGMFARASIELEEAEVFAVPALAVLKLQGSNERFIFIEEEGRARRVVVELGDRFDDMVELVSDEISPGDKLIIAGQARLVDGVAVRVRQ